MSVEQARPPDFSNAELRDIVAQIAFETSKALINLQKIAVKQSSSNNKENDYIDKSEDFIKSVDSILDMVAKLKGFDLDA